MLGVLTKMLNPQYVQSGFELVEDQDTVYLLRDGERAQEFPRTITIPEVETWIDDNCV